MDEIKLKETQWEDLEDLLLKIEDKLNFRFDNSELECTADFEELVSHIMSKIDKEDDTLCTSLLAFYKIKNIVRDIELYDTSKLCPSTKLKDIFPKKNRLRLINAFEQRLGYKLDILKPNHFILYFCSIILFFSIIGLFFYFKLAIIGILISIVGIKCLYAFTKKLKYDTIRDLIEGNLCVNYLAFRQERTTINRKELRILLYKFFSTNLAFDKDELLKISFQ